MRRIIECHNSHLRQSSSGLGGGSGDDSDGGSGDGSDGGSGGGSDGGSGDDSDGGSSDDSNGGSGDDSDGGSDGGSGDDPDGGSGGGSQWRIEAALHHLKAGNLQHGHDCHTFTCLGLKYCRT